MNKNWIVSFSSLIGAILYLSDNKVSTKSTNMYLYASHKQLEPVPSLMADTLKEWFWRNMQILYLRSLDLCNRTKKFISPVSVKNVKPILWLHLDNLTIFIYQKNCPISSSDWIHVNITAVGESGCFITVDPRKGHL